MLCVENAKWLNHFFFMVLPICRPAKWMEFFFFCRSFENSNANHKPHQVKGVEKKKCIICSWNSDTAIYLCVLHIIFFLYLCRFSSAMQNDFVQIHSFASRKGNGKICENCILILNNKIAWKTRKMFIQDTILNTVYNDDLYLCSFSGCFPETKD